MRSEITHQELLDLLTARVQKSSQSQLARDFDMSVSFLNQILRGEKPITEKLAERLGYSRVTVFRKAG